MERSGEHIRIPVYTLNIRDGTGIEHHFLTHAEDFEVGFRYSDSGKHVVLL